MVRPVRFVDQRLPAAADDAAGQIATRAAGSGFAGVAHAMSGVRDARRQLHARIAQLGTAVNEARARVVAASDQMSPERTIAVLTPVTKKIGTIHAGIGVAIAEVDKVRQRINSVLQGGQPGPTLSRLDAINKS